MSEQPSLWSELKAMFREGIKEIREAVVERGWFGHPEGPGEAGTPLNPLYSEVAQERGVLHGSPSYSDMLREASQRGVPEQDRGLER